MKFTLKKNGVVVNIIEAPNGYTNPDFDVSPYSQGDTIPSNSVAQTHNRKPSRAQFIGLFSDNAWNAIRVHSSNKLRKWLDQLSGMSVIDLDDPIVTDGISALESNSVITSQEKAIILAGVEL